jgi:hypothetical protein
LSRAGGQAFAQAMVPGSFAFGTATFITPAGKTTAAGQNASSCPAATMITAR